VVLLPAVTVWLAGLAAIEKSFAGGGGGGAVITSVTLAVCAADGAVPVMVSV